MKYLSPRNLLTPLAGLAVASAGCSDGAPDPETESTTAEVLGCEVPPAVDEPDERVYVAPNGNDGASGSRDAPLRSLGEAVSRLSGGGTVIVRGGVYPDQHSFDAIGHSKDYPLVIRAADGETPIFDGGNVSGEYSAVIVFNRAENVVVDGLEVRNCSARDCQGFDNNEPVRNLTVRNSHVHDVYGSGMRFSGTDVLLQGNYVHDVSLMNTNNAAGEAGWPTCMGTKPNRDTPQTPLARDFRIIDNRIENCWGEGIGIWFADGVQVERNVVVNPYNVGIYADNSMNVRIANNYANVSRGGGGGNGIMISSEHYPGWGITLYPALGYEVVNNIIIGGAGVRWWPFFERSEVNRYDDLNISNNVLIGRNGPGGDIGEVGGWAEAPTDNVALRNVIADSGDSGVGNPGAWRVEDNHEVGSSTASRFQGIDSGASILEIFREAVDISEDAGLPDRVGVAARCR